MSQLTKLYHIEAVYDSKHLNFAGKSAMIHHDQAHLFSNKMEVAKYKCHVQDVMGYVNCNEGKSIIQPSEDYILIPLALAMAFICLTAVNSY